jgi:rhodanese-related sulfurtransferase
MTNPLADDKLDVSPAEIADALESGSATVIDVREPYEREAGHIEGTRHIELERLAGQAESIDREKPVIFLCRLGRRSIMAAQAFRAAGYDAHSLAGGIQAWVEEGRAIAPEDGHVADH